MTELLEKARLQLDSGSMHCTRRACWLTRSALEGIVHDLLLAKGIDPSRASQRAKLSCLEGAYFDQRELAAAAQYAWNRLSEACHQHAYHLAPTYTEAKQLIELVGDLVPSRWS